jgi:hypothetical protein
VTGSDERVDLGDNDSESDSDTDGSMEYTGTILALAAPSLEHEHTAVVIPVEGHQPEPEGTQEDILSQVEDATEGGNNDSAVNIPGPSRISLRLGAASDNAARIAHRASRQAAT